MKCKVASGIYLIKDEGVIDKQIVKLCGSLVAVSADNPAANLIAGYKSLTSAFRKCRNCMAVEETMQTKVTNLLLFCMTMITILNSSMRASM